MPRFIHPSYESNLKLWTRIRDVIAGEDAVKARGTTYLPALEDQTTGDYNAYKQRAVFFGATNRTVQALSNRIFRRPPVVEAPDSLKEHLQEIGVHGASFSAENKQLAVEILQMGRYGMMVDAPAEGEEGDPFIVAYKAESITDWSHGRVRGRAALTRVVLREDIPEEEITDTLSEEDKIQYRELVLLEGAYVQRVWRRRGDQYGHKAWVIVETVQPLMRGRALPYIPFVIPGPKGLDPAIQAAPILDLVNTNLAHYRASADLEHGRHYTALPTPYIAGLTPDGDGKLPDVKWGPNHVLCLPMEAKPGMIEFKGAGLNYAENGATERKKEMLALGARMLDTDRLTAENPVAMELRLGGENAVLSDIADAASEAATRVLRYWAAWMGEEDLKSISVRFNRDFDLHRLNARDLSALLKGYKDGTLPLTAVYHQLKEGDILQDDLSLEEFRGLMDDEAEKWVNPNPKPAPASAPVQK